MSELGHRYEPGVWHHITVNTAAHRLVFDDKSRILILQSKLNQARKRHGLLCAAYAIMPDHFHWVIYPTEAGFEDFAVKQIQSGGRYAHDPAAYYLSRIVDDIKRKAAQEILRVARSLPQQLWQAGFWDRPIADMRKLPDAVEYIHLNPVRAGYVSHPADYPFSSYNALVHGHPHIVVLDRGIWENLKISPA
jgi:putative transposase